MAGQPINVAQYIASVRFIVHNGAWPIDCPSQY